MTQKKKLAVCGCSFQAPSNQWKDIYNLDAGSYVGTHWSEVLSKRMDFELVNLAVPGASTAVVVLQIFEAIRQKVDFIVIGNSASSNRMEFFRKDNRGGPPDIRNFYYAVSRDNPFKTAGEEVNDYLISVGMPSIEPEEFRNYIALNVPGEMLDIKDDWMFLHAIHKLVKSKIPFLVFEGRVSMPNMSLNDELLELCTEDNIIFKKDFEPFPTYLSAFEFPSYHTPPEQQIPIADYVEARIKKFMS